MAEKLKELPGKALEWWNKFTSRQKTIITVSYTHLTLPTICSV